VEVHPARHPVVVPPAPVGDTAPMGLDTVKMNRFTLAFDDAGLEREFLDGHADAARTQLRVTWLVVGVGFASLLLTDASAHVPPMSSAVRNLIAFPALGIGLASTFLSVGAFRRVYVAVTSVALSAILFQIPLQIVAMMLWVPNWTTTVDLEVAPGYGMTGQMLTILGALTVATLRVRTVILPAVASAVAYVVLAGAYPIHGFVAAAAGMANAALLLGVAASYQLEAFRRRLFIERLQLAQERAKSETLLLNVLPAEIAERLKSDPSHIADGFAEVTILFADIVGFTDLSARLSPAEVVAMLNRLFTAFDDLAEKHGLEKIKTIGDAYMVVGGLPEARPDHAEAVVAMALGMRDAVAAVAKQTGYSLKVRIGANSGPVVAGVIGKKKFAYDLWGDAVNTASRMESHGLPGEIQVTEATWARVKDSFELESRGTITVKGKGELAAWFVRGRKVAEGTAQA